MANTFPDTDDFNVAALAVAWEIVKATYVTGNTVASGDNGATNLTNAVIKMYNAILSQEPMGK